MLPLVLICVCGFLLGFHPIYAERFSQCMGLLLFEDLLLVKALFLLMLGQAFTQ